MDPNANLREQRELVREIQRVWNDCNADGTLTAVQAEHVADRASRLAELVAALDQWLSNGGFPPEAWIKWKPL